MMFLNAWGALPVGSDHGAGSCVHFGVIDRRPGHRRACRGSALRGTHLCRHHTREANR